MCRRDGLDVLEKGRMFCRCRNSNPGLCNLYPSRYTDCAIPATVCTVIASARSGCNRSAVRSELPQTQIPCKIGNTTCKPFRSSRQCIHISLRCGMQEHTLYSTRSDIVLLSQNKNRSQLRYSTNDTCRVKS